VSNTFNIIQVNTTDIPRLSVFLGQHATIKKENEWKNILEWIWVYNPSVQQGTQLGWALEDMSGSICGFIGNVPVQYAAYGKEEPAIWGTSWYVAEKAKDFGLKMYIHFTRQTEMIFSNTQTPRVEVVMKKLGFKEMPVQWFTGAYFFPLHVFTTGFFRNMIAGFSIKKAALGFLAMIMKVLQAPFFVLYNRKSFAKDIQIEKIDTFLAATDQWFNEFIKETDLTCVRDQNRYNWLFSHPVSAGDFFKYQVFYKDKLQGFLIYKKRVLKNFSYIEIIDEALLPLPDDIKRKIILKAFFTLYKEAGECNFLLLRSNMKNSAGFFKSLLGIRYPIGEKGYIKSAFVKPGTGKPVITSIDGDNLFF
jgi:hypothetical protein